MIQKIKCSKKYASKPKYVKYFKIILKHMSFILKIFENKIYVEHFSVQCVKFKCNRLISIFVINFLLD